VLSGTVQLVKRHRNPDVDLSRLLTRIETASARATSLVRSLADAQALESSGFTLQVDTHDVREIVRPIVDMMDRFSDRHPIVLNAPERPVRVTADGERMQRVFENLLNNAIKYSPDGGLVEVSVEADDAHARIHVRDHGIGIAPDVLPPIFDSSYRAPEAAACAPGLGLGLSIAAQVIARHRGTIDAAPRDGGGTVFTVCLPLAPVEPHDGSATSTPRSVRI
jgi:signal transduction histidine kinase